MNDVLGAAVTALIVAATVLDFRAPRRRRQAVEQNRAQTAEKADAPIDLAEFRRARRAGGDRDRRR